MADMLDKYRKEYQKTGECPMGHDNIVGYCPICGTNCTHARGFY